MKEKDEKMERQRQRANDWLAAERRAQRPALDGIRPDVAPPAGPRLHAEGPLHGCDVPPATLLGGDGLAVELGDDGPDGQAVGAELADAGEGRLLGGVLDQGDAIVGEVPAERDGADALPAGFLVAQRIAGAFADRLAFPLARP